MKTTIDIVDNIFRQVKQLASKRNSSIKLIVEEALRSYLSIQQPRRSKFSLKDGSFGGKGLQPGLREGDWDQIRSLAYEDHGA